MVVRAELGVVFIDASLTRFHLIEERVIKDFILGMSKFAGFSFRTNAFLVDRWALDCLIEEVWACFIKDWSSSFKRVVIVEAVEFVAGLIIERIIPRPFLLDKSTWVDFIMKKDLLIVRLIVFDDFKRHDLRMRFLGVILGF